MMGDVNTQVVGMVGDVNTNVLVSMVYVNTKVPACDARARAPSCQTTLQGYLA